MFVNLYICLFFFIVSWGNCFSLVFKVNFISLGELYCFFNFFYICFKVLFGYVVFVVFIFKVNLVDFGIRYFVSKLIFLNGVILSFFVIFLKFVFYVIKILGWLVNLVNFENSNFFFNRNLVRFLIILLLLVCFILKGVVFGFNEFLCVFWYIGSGLMFFIFGFLILVFLFLG